MTREFAPDRLDVRGLASSQATIEGRDPLSTFERLRDEVISSDVEPQIAWSAEGDMRQGVDGDAVPWLCLKADVTVQMECQRCLTPVDIPLSVDRWFRFVNDESTAASEDEDSEEDVLVASREFDLKGLIEDELLMEIPSAPRHDVCPVDVKLSAADEAFDASDAQRTNPFAALDALRKK